MIIPNDLLQKVANNQVILFAGAGVSMNIGLPSWKSLIEYMALDLKIDPSVFINEGTFLELAEYYSEKMGSLDPLIEWMRVNFSVPDQKIKQCKIYELIAKLEFRKIYTTNYDHTLEQAHSIYNKSYKRVVGVEDIQDSDVALTEIIKYHGDLNDAETIVLTESSYYRRLSLSSALDIKLQSDALGNSFLFIGYSLSDMDVRYLLSRMHKLSMSSERVSTNHKSYLLVSSISAVQRLILKNQGFKIIEISSADIGKKLEHFLQHLLDVKLKRGQR